jgi:nucleoid-associated protein Lsr2
MQRLDVQLEDDLSGGPADETVAFGIDGRSYEIDLSAQHAADFRRKLARFIERARVDRARRARAAVRTSASRERSRQIRAWAQAQGFDLAAHGRLPGQIIAQYEREGLHGQQPGDGTSRPTRDRSRNVKSAAAPPRRRSGGRRRIAGKLSPVRCGRSLIAGKSGFLSGPCSRARSTWTTRLLLPGSNLMTSTRLQRRIGRWATVLTASAR